MQRPAWIELDGAVNARDLGGLPTTDGGQTVPRRLLRSDSLQRLSDADVRLLVDDFGLRSVADLRTGVEVRSEGPGPMLREPDVDVVHLSLFPEPDVEADVEAVGDEPVVLPWQQRTDEMSPEERRRGVAGVYLRYLDDRPDSVLAALRMIAADDGATLVHCAAGKDRTGVVVALALAEVGVTPEAIVADYAATAERIRAIIDGLTARATYRQDLGNGDAEIDYDRHTPKAETMAALLAHLNAEHGGAAGWLRTAGWTEDDAQRLRTRLLA